MSSFLLRLRRAVPGRSGSLGALYAVQASNVLFLTLALPWVARRLGVDGFGEYVAAMAMAGLAAIVVDFGYTHSGTRDAAQCAGDPSALALLAGTVTAVKIGIAALVIAAAGAAALGQSGLVLIGDPIILGAYCGAAQGLNFTWYLQGTQRMHMLAAIEIAVKLLTVVLLLGTVTSPDDMRTAMISHTVANVIGAVLGGAVVLRTTRPRWPTLPGLRRAVARAVPLFVFNASVGIYNSVNPLLVSVLAGNSAAALYGGAERLVKVLLTLMQPLNRLLTPWVFRSAAGSPQDARFALLASTGTLVAFGSLGWLCTQLGAPLLIELFLGSDFALAETPLRVLATTVPAIALSTALGTQWMLALGRDRAFASFATVCAICSVGLSVAVVPQFGALGMAAAALTTEGLMLLLVLLNLWRFGLYRREPARSHAGG